MTDHKTSKHSRWRMWLTALACLALAALVFFLLCPRLTCARLRARKAICAHNLQGLGLAMCMYAGDYGGHFPSELRLLVTEDYHLSMKVYICPDTSTIESSAPEDFDEERHCDYVYLGAGLTQNCDGSPPTRTIILHDRAGNHAGFFNICFADGHVAGYTGADIQTIAKRKGLFIPKPEDAELEQSAAASPGD